MRRPLTSSTRNADRGPKIEANREPKKFGAALGDFRKTMGGVGRPFGMSDDQFLPNLVPSRPQDAVSVSIRKRF